MTTVHFGVDSRISLPDQAIVARCGEPRGPAITDPTLTTRAALANPLEFPALTDTVVPGDRVVLTIESGMVQTPGVVAGVVLELLEAGIDPHLISVVRTEFDAKTSLVPPTRDLPNEIGNRIEIRVHDATNRESLALLGLSSKDEPIYMNRVVVDADVVVPIGVMHPRDLLGYLGVHGALFPTFADSDTMQRFLAPCSALSEKEIDQRRKEAKEATWLLGTRMIVQVVPGSGDQLLHVLAGDADAVEAEGHRLCDLIWNCQVPRRASLVVAAMPGGREQQTWVNFARTVTAALRVVEDNGAIAICSHIKSRPGPSLKRIGRAGSLDDASRAIDRDRTPDALPATQLVRALERSKVYLLSQLDEDVVHDMGLAYVACPEEIERLAGHHDSWIVLQNAHNLIPTVVT